MLKGEGKFSVYGSKAVISVPSIVWKDSQYPFKRGEKVEVEIVGEELRIRKIKKRKKEEKKIILVVDDEPRIQELMKEYLSSLNVEIYSAYSGMEAIEVYKKLLANGKKPYLVIMDLNLSGSINDNELIKQMRGEEMDGVKTTREIKRIDPTANIIGFSAFAHLEWGKRLIDAGASSIFGREIGFENFARKIDELISTNSLFKTSPF